MMSRATPDDSQGELQGVLSSSAALATIVSPLLMTWVFSIFAAKDADPYLPGAPFLVSAALMVLSLAIFAAHGKPAAA
jgi:DHA1 family tetracycline resistance protein-like MFS transporter